MKLGLINLQRLIYYKAQTTNQSVNNLTEHISFYFYCHEVKRVIFNLSLPKENKICLDISEVLTQSACGWGCRIHRLQMGKNPPSNKCPRYDTKQSDGTAPVKFEVSGMQSTLSLPLLPGPLWPGVEAPERVLSMGQQNCSTFKTVYLC